MRGHDAVHDHEGCHQGDTDLDDGDLGLPRNDEDERHEENESDLHEDGDSRDKTDEHHDPGRPVPPTPVSIVSPRVSRRAGHDTDAEGGQRQRESGMKLNPDDQHHDQRDGDNEYAYQCRCGHRCSLQD